MDETPGRGIEKQIFITVDGAEYKLHLFSPTRALKLSARLAKFIGEPIAAMASAAGDEARSLDVLPIAVKSLLNNLHEDEVIGLLKDLIACATHENKSINFDLHFEGALGRLFKLSTEIIKYQFSDFFAVIGQAITAAGSMEMKK
jgi:hypothetical protein